jgi:hypothetical protein
MKIKITEILEKKEPLTLQGGGSSQAWIVNGQLKQDDGTITNLSNEFISTNSQLIKDNFRVGEVFVVEGKKSKNGGSYLRIIEPKPQEKAVGYGGTQKKISFEQYSSLVSHCWNLSKFLCCEEENAGEYAVKIFDKILACASVTVDVETLESDIDKKIDEANKKLDNIKDEDIPF